jgi:positive regulator of sigma E activity
MELQIKESGEMFRSAQIIYYLLFVFTFIITVLLGVLFVKEITWIIIGKSNFEFEALKNTVIGILFVLFLFSFSITSFYHAKSYNYEISILENIIEYNSYILNKKILHRKILFDEIKDISLYKKRYFKVSDRPIITVRYQHRHKLIISTLFLKKKDYYRFMDALEKNTNTEIRVISGIRFFANLLF